MIIPEIPKTAVVVMKLPGTLLGCGHKLWMVNFYNSPELAGQLKIEHSIACVGTLKLNRKNIPTEVNDKKNEERKNHSKTIGFSHDTKMV